MASNAAMSDYLGRMVLDASMADGTFVHPTNVFIGFSTATITAATTGGGVTEPSNWTTYKRTTITGAALTIAGLSSGGGANEKTTGSEIVIDSGATSSPDENLTDWFVSDAKTVGTGNIFWFGKLNGTITVQDGNPVKIPAGDIDLQIDRDPQVAEA